MNDTPEMFEKSPAAELGQILERMAAWVQVCDLDGKILSVNQAATEISGYDRSEMIGQSWPYPWLAGQASNAITNAEWTTGQWPITELLRSGRVDDLEATCITKDGRARILEATLSILKDDVGQSTGVLVSAWDVTDRKGREVDLGQAQKMQAVSQLASGIAHDINNNLAVILGYSEFLLSTSESFGPVVRQALSAIQEQSVDCANTVRRIQLFSRNVSKTRFSSFSLTRLIEDVIEVNKAEWDEKSRGENRAIRIQTDLADLPEIYSYQDGLKEALSGLLVNAMEALPSGGVVSLRSRISGDRVVISVEDNGEGITPEVINRIFDAFFTTKGPASSGLGLSIAYNLITQQGGTISVDSQEGKGTTFTIALPYRAGEATSVPPLEQRTTQKQLSVLVVDDEPLVADVFRTFLEAFGNQVVTCLTGSSALEAFRRQDFDLALIDLGMPVMDGWEVSRQINTLKPDLPIILATGWNVSVEDGMEQGAQVQAVLKKPFGMQELSNAIDRALV